MFYKEKLLESLHDKRMGKRLRSLKLLVKSKADYNEFTPQEKEIVPLHVTSSAYYSLYSPTMCAYLGHKFGCFAIALNDYATVASYNEFKKACEFLRLPYAVGYHVDVKGLFGEKRGRIYGYGASLYASKYLNEDLKNARAKKHEEVVALIQKLNYRLKKYEIKLDYKTVVSSFDGYKGGTIGKKHVAKCLAEALVEKFGKGETMLDFLTDVLKIEGCKEEVRYIKEEENSYFTTDLAKVLYMRYRLFNEKDVEDDGNLYIQLNNKYGLISSYYVSNSVYKNNSLEKIYEVVSKNGYNAITIKDSDFSEEEATRLYTYFNENGMLVVSFYRVGLPRQHIPSHEVSPISIKNSFAIIGNAISTSSDSKDGLFGENTVARCTDFEKRLNLFYTIGRRGK